MSQSNEKKEKTPIMVFNPENETHVVVTPLLELIHGKFYDDANDVSKSIEDVIRFINISCIQDSTPTPHTRNDMFFILYGLKDMFSKLEDVKL